MKIAFVGKGGSGKSTLTTLFSLYVASLKKSLLVMDADINMHMPELLGMDAKEFPEKYLSTEKNVKHIQEYLKGNNERIASHAHFKKSTPPARGSRWIDLVQKDPVFFGNYAVTKDHVDLMVVGSYEKDGIGTSCYHNNLSIVENMLSHMRDNEGVLVMDMVAGIDAFAGTLHSQFDMMVLVVEPTRRSMEVYTQYRTLAAEAGIANRLFVLGNKVVSEGDHAYIVEHVSPAHLLGIFPYSTYIHEHDQKGGALSLTALEDTHISQLGKVFEQLQTRQRSLEERLPELWKLHKKYVAQEYIRARVGDLTHQIDESLLEVSPQGLSQIHETSSSR